jgi:hypothetical protein
MNHYNLPKLNGQGKKLSHNMELSINLLEYAYDFSKRRFARGKRKPVTMEEEQEIALLLEESELVDPGFANFVKMKHDKLRENNKRKEIDFDAWPNEINKTIENGWKKMCNDILSSNQLIPDDVKEKITRLFNVIIYTYGNNVESITDAYYDEDYDKDYDDL